MSKILYHGSPKAQMVSFDPDYAYKGKRDRKLGQGIYFSTDESDCEQYKTGKGRIYSCKVAYAQDFPVFSDPLSDEIHSELISGLKKFDPSFWQTAKEEYEEYQETWSLEQWYQMLLYENRSNEKRLIDFFATQVEIYGSRDNSRSHHSGVIYCAWHPDHVKILEGC